jgi:hypothetical protein
LGGFRVLEASDFTGCDFTGACLAGARFDNSKLCDAVLDYCDLTDTSFFRADMTGVSLLGSNLTLDKRTLLYKLDGVKGLDLMALYEADAVLGEEYRRFLRTERRMGSSISVI